LHCIALHCSKQHGLLPRNPTFLDKRLAFWTKDWLAVEQGILSQKLILRWQRITPTEDLVEIMVISLNR
jgi:hypothetical protein